MHKCLSTGAIVILLYQTIEQYPTRHRYTAVALSIVAIKISTILTSVTQDYLVSLLADNVKKIQIILIKNSDLVTEISLLDWVLIFL